MPVVEEENAYRKPRYQIQNPNRPISGTDPVPSISHSRRPKPTISAILTRPTITDDQPDPIFHRKKNFSSSAFRGLGCRASSEVSVPSVIRASAEWDSQKVKKKKKQRTKKGKKPSSSMAVDGGSGIGLTTDVDCVPSPDVWCGPGIGFTTDVDCVVSRRAVSGRGKDDGEKIIQREHPSYSVRRAIISEDIPLHESSFGMTHSRQDISGSRHYRHARNGFPEGLAEILTIQNNLLMGGRSGAHDRFREWRLDIDNMSYEELLELGERIGHVSTGLTDNEMNVFLQKTRLQVLDNLSSHFLAKKCSICQEEYEADDETAKLDCGHFYHIHCIKQWLLLRNSCPICKSAARKSQA